MLEKANMLPHSSIDTRDFAPTAWGAICELTGGEERLLPASRIWAVSFIVKLGSEAINGKIVRPQELDSWHVCGHFSYTISTRLSKGSLSFHFSVTLPKMELRHIIFPDGIGIVARHPYDNPQVVTPYMARRGGDKYHEFNWFVDQARDASKWNLFQQTTGMWTMLSSWDA